MIRNLLVVASIILIALGAATSENEADSHTSTLEERLEPFGKSCLEGEDCGSAAPAMGTGAGTGLSAKEIYDKYCHVCHQTGVSEAPLFASDQWDERVEKGADVLLENSKKGFNLMPPMGTCLDCSDEELQASIDYLISGTE